eukprot:CAMPEP_0116133106 /NCGR_PEP_ID=MMETSP0329-20121206/9924_1 /TAXON_ID=697910 /ORGANISM="Pseudo-nitzschia arenysensis, Strain B593" /LENGTH=455 /DNA_ID=CAMNT_0003627705 /DNA_START=278 /DNA_END=1645 /DNA_ORIENTATION=+
MANGLVYSGIQGRAGQPEQQQQQQQDPNTVVSEEEQNEVVGKNKMQVKLSPLQVCLYPTYLTLPEDVLQDDLRDNLQDLVSQELRQEYGDDFVYFAVTDASIGWYSGEGPKSMCRNSLASSKLSSEDRSAAMGQPCTCALYTGATVMFHTTRNNNATSQTILEPQISDLLIRDLVPNLHTSGNSESFYTELKGASISWTAAQRVQGGKLVYLDAADSADEQLLPPEPVEELELEPVVLDEDVQDSTVITVNSLQGADVQESKGANAFGSQPGKVLASTIGGLIFLMLCILVCVLCIKRRQRKLREAGGGKDSSTVVSEVDEEIPGRRRKKRSDSDASLDDESEAAQYKSGNSSKILDCISVGSEWTMTTSGLKSNKTMAEMIAAKETFDRDRQITLQKDMLQSEWSAGVVSPSGVPLSRAAGSYNNKKPSQAAGGLQFEQATGEGEEIFLMQPAR